jgi:hypothetical protein
MIRLLRPLTALAFAAVALAPQIARADDTIKHPGDHPSYGFELEPHLLFGWDNIYPGSGFGLGGRFAIPIVQNGFVPTINNSVAISFGLDFLHHSATNCFVFQGATYGCGDANFLYFPVTMQWNFYVAQKWSVFGEPGIFIYHGFFDANCPPGGGNACNYFPSDTGIRPAFYVGGRYHFNDKVSLTMRIGFPTISVGVSWFL